MNTFRKAFLFCTVFAFSLSINAQRIYNLPGDPIRSGQFYDFNWLKKTSEDAINNRENESYEYLYSFMKHFFWEFKDQLSAIGKDQYKSTNVFNWAKPYIKAKISDLELFEKITLFNSLTRTQSYLKSFSYEAEEKYLEANESLFAWYSPSDFFDSEWKYPYPNKLSNPYRDFEAFMFRRIRSGVNKSMIERFLSEIIMSLNLNFSQQVLRYNASGYPLYEFYWDRNHFNGTYKEYDEFNNYGSQNKNTKTWLKAIGEYKGGKKNGIWKYYRLSYTPQDIPTSPFSNLSSNAKPVLDCEIEYLNDKPIRLKEYYEESIKGADDKDLIYTLVFNLELQAKTLNVDVYSDKKLIKTYNSEYNNIAYWDIYDTRRRISRNLGNLNLDIPIEENFTLKNKPNVARNSKTNNYTLYDDLNRSGKDHALLIATDQYDNYGRYNKLSNPVRDVEAIAANLKSIYGFNCEILRNPTKQQFFDALKKYENMQFAKDEQLLIFISGHGMYDDNMKDGFIVPKDGKDPYYDASHTTYISYTELSSAISRMESNHTLLMIDACYSGALEQAVAKLKGEDDTLGRRMSDPKLWFLNRINFKNKMYITSSSADRMTSDGINHSPFSTMFIRALQTIKDRNAYILDVEDVFAMLNKISPTPQRGIFRDHDPESSFFFVMQ